MPWRLDRAAVRSTAPSRSRASVTASTVACEGTLQAGQEVHVSGSGFAAGASVSVYVTSPGLGDDLEQQVATVTADSHGAISATVRVPLAATGFVQVGPPPG